MGSATNKTQHVIASKYGIQRGEWFSEEAQGTCGVSFWRYIRKNWGAFSNLFPIRLGMAFTFTYGMIFGAVIVL